MKVLAVQGSPRKKGNTAALLRYVMGGIGQNAKIFIDRLYALMMGEDNRNLAGKRLAVILTYGGADPNSGVDIVKRMFTEITGFTGMRFEEVYGVCSGEIEVENNLTAANRARYFGATLTANSL